jgi:hypothetical protein
LLEVVTMADRIILHLSEKWSLGYDRNQWVVLRRWMHRGKEKWQAVSFVGSEKRILMRVLREKGAEVSPEAERVLEGLPDRFLDWYAALSPPTTSKPDDALANHPVALGDEAIVVDSDGASWRCLWSAEGDAANDGRPGS